MPWNTKKSSYISQQTPYFWIFFDINQDKSFLNNDIDPCKLVAALIKYPKNFQHQLTISGVNSVAYESEFSRTIGTCQPEDAEERGHIVYIKIQDEHDPNFT